MRPRRYSWLFVLLAGWFSGAVPSVFAQVQATLVTEATTVRAGQPFTAAIRLEHDSHWHTYWLQAGTGYPTAIEWELPEGWTAGEIQWPTPNVIRDRQGTITGNGYEGVTLLPVQITPSARAEPGQRVTLKAAVDWLMCADVCIPGDAQVEAVVTIADAGAPPAERNSAVLSALAALPKPLPALNASVARDGERVVLRLSGADVSGAKGLWFFAEDAWIQYDAPQEVRPVEGGVEMVLPLSASYEGAGDRLVGVLRRDDAWPGAAGAGVRLDVPVGVAGAPGGATASAAEPATALAGTLLLAFVGGLILNLMPCVFPVLGIKILGFVNQAGADRRKVALHGLVFTAGVLLSFWTLAAVLAILRAGGEQLGWGFQLQSPAFVFGLAVVMLVFALAMSGVFEFGLSATGVGSQWQMKQGYSGSFFTGVLATVVATPCSAPFLAPALGAALALPTTQSFLVFTAIAVGLSVPYLLLSLFPQAVRMLPRPGAWMETFKQVMAFPLYATVGYLIWVLAGQTTENGLLMALFGLTIVALAVWCYGRYTAAGARPGRRRFGVMAGLVLLAGGLLIGWPRPAAPTDVVWQPWSTEAVAAARAEGRPVYVDFTARWCATCQTNKRIVFSSDEVKARFRERDVVMLKADWTNRDSAITQELAKWGRSAVPFNLLYLPGRDAPLVLPELLTPGIVLDALDQPAIAQR